MKWYMDESVIKNKGGYISAVLLSEKAAIKLVRKIKNHLKINGYTVRNELKLSHIAKDNKGKRQIEWIKKIINTHINKKNIKFYSGITNTNELVSPYQTFINELLEGSHNIVVDESGFKNQIMDGIFYKKRVQFQKSHACAGIQIADLALAFKTK